MSEMLSIQKTIREKINSTTMKIQTICWILLTGIISCNENSRKSSLKTFTSPKITEVQCDDSVDIQLIKLSKEFQPNSIELKNSLNRKTQDFLLSLDTNCLRRQKHYSYFIVTILLKQYLYHVKCCKQGYDLYGMKSGAPSIVIGEFERLSGIQGKKKEFLVSSSIVKFVAKDSLLATDRNLSDLLKEINIENEKIL